MMEKDNTWDCVTITKEIEVISLILIYKTKLNQTGEIQWYNRKAKFGCNFSQTTKQHVGIFTKTFP